MSLERAKWILANYKSPLNSMQIMEFKLAMALVSGAALRGR